MLSAKDANSSFYPDSKLDASCCLKVIAIYSFLNPNSYKIWKTNKLNSAFYKFKKDYPLSLTSS